jgi:hypothetical protein
MTNPPEDPEGPDEITGPNKNVFWLYAHVSMVKLPEND